MDRFSDALNEMLVDIYQNVMRLEQQTIQKKNISLSINEMHMIEQIGKGGDAGLPVSEIAAKMNITRPSATVAVNKLEKKGYVQKQNCEADGRVVDVVLTREGKKIDRFHSYYHRNMVREISADLSEPEKECLLKVMRKLDGYFIKSIGGKK